MDWIANINWAGATCFGIFVVLPIVGTIANYFWRRNLLEQGIVVVNKEEELDD